MRYFSSVVQSTSTIAWFADTKLGETDKYNRLIRLFNCVFENHVDSPVRSWAPSEQRALRDFLRFAKAVRSRRSDYAADHPGSYVLSNLNTGAVIIFVVWYGLDEYGFDGKF